ARRRSAPRTEREGFSRANRRSKSRACVRVVRDRERRGREVLQGMRPAAMNLRVFLCAVCALCLLSARTAFAQFQMPDPTQMSGVPRPVDDLASGSISVRLIRGSLSNNIAKHPVELRVGSEVRKATTDENGRAQFDKVPGGATVKASADVDGEHLESQE